MSSPPDQVPPTPPPPPIRESGEDVALAKEKERKKQAARHGYAATVSPSRSAFSGTAVAEPKRSLLG